MDFDLVIICLVLRPSIKNQKLMRKTLIFLAITVLVMACKTETKQETPAAPNAQNIIDKAIEVSGGAKYDDFKMEFDFRKRHYVTERHLGTFKYERITKDSVNTVVEGYGNATAYYKTVNGETQKVADSLVQRIQNSINSVNYFVLLPYGLNDAAVNKTYLEKVTIKGASYHKIQVTFNQDGGGDDFEDVYVYWIHADSYKVDYLAYSYHVNGGGMRFREAYNERMVNGLRIVDYKNYKSNNAKTALLDLDKAFESGELKLLSKIETENVKVN